MAKALVIGAKGLLGTALCRALREEYETVGMGRDECNLEDEACVRGVLRTCEPDLLVNCAGFLNADRCEEDPVRSYAVNACGPRTLIRAATELRRPPCMVHFSSDFVFSGARGGYTENDLPMPLNAYGMHKWLADDFILHVGYPRLYVLRIASVIGLASKPGFLAAVLRRVARQGKASVVGDIRISLTTTDFICDVVRKVLSSESEPGLYNCVSEGVTSWLDVARHAAKLLGVSGSIEAMPAAQYNYVARRPMTSTLSIAKISGLMRIPTWSDVLEGHVTRWRAQYEELVGA